MKYLLLGGTRDGERVDVPGNPPEIRSCVDMNPMYVETYHRTIVSDGTHTHAVYVQGEMTTEDVLRRLIDGYRPAPAGSEENAR